MPSEKRVIRPCVSLLLQGIYGRVVVHERFDESGEESSKAMNGGPANVRMNIIALHILKLPNLYS